MYKQKKESSGFLYGVNPVFEALRAKRRKLERLHYANVSGQRLQPLIDLARAAKVETVISDPNELKKLSGTGQHQGVVLFCGNLPKLNLKNWKSENEKTSQKLLICERITDPQNFGAVLRTAKFHGYDAVLKLKDHSCSLTAGVSKSSAGALETSVILEEVNLQNALKSLKKSEFFIYGSDMKGNSVFEETPPEKFALILGSEGSGMRALTEKNCDRILAIPGSENFESLNLGVAAGILMSHLQRNSK